MVVTHFHDDLCRGISQLEDVDDYDVIIQVGVETDLKEFKAHSVILQARCPYFKAALSDNWVQRNENIYHFQKPNISPAIFLLILRYIMRLYVNSHLLYLTSLNFKYSHNNM